MPLASTSPKPQTAHVQVLRVVIADPGALVFFAQVDTTTYAEWLVARWPREFHIRVEDPTLYEAGSVWEMTLTPLPQ